MNYYYHVLTFLFLLISNIVIAMENQINTEELQKRYRTNTSNNPARLSSRTTTSSSTHSSTPTASAPSLPQSTTASTANLYREGNVSTEKLFMSTTEKTGFDSPGSEETKVLRGEIAKFIRKYFRLKSSESSETKEVIEEKVARNKSGSLSIIKPTPEVFEDFLVELTHQFIKYFDTKIDRTYCQLVYGKDGENGKNSIAAINRFLGIEFYEQKEMIFRPGQNQNRLKTVISETLQEYFKENPIITPPQERIEKKSSFSDKCCLYTLMGVNVAFSATAATLALANMYT